MTAWAHLEINVSDDGNVGVNAYNADPSSVLDAAESWEDLLSMLGEQGWELVQVVPDDDVTYWFKKRV